MKEFEENLLKLRRWFPTVEFISTDTICKYTLAIGNGLTATVSVFVGKDSFSSSYSLAESEWLITINSVEDEYYCRKPLADMSKSMGSFQVWMSRVKEDEYLKADSIDLLTTFMSLLWMEIFERHIKNYGLITGSWVSGVILV